MKREYCLFFVFSILLPIGTYAVENPVDSLQFDSTFLSSGIGPITSGLDVNIKFGSYSRVLQFQMNQDRGYFVYEGWTNRKNYLGISAGMFKNTPWIGPIITTSLLPRTTIVVWPTVRAGDNEHPRAEIAFDGFYVATYIDLNFITTYIAATRFRGKSYVTPGGTMYIPINRHFKVASDCSYNALGGDIFFQIGVKWSPWK